MTRPTLALLALSPLAACSGPDCDPEAEGVQSVVTLWADADADGYTAAEPEERCVGEALPDGWLDTPGETDCDDAAATVHAGAPDIAGDGVDQDCDGADSTAGLTADVVYVDPGHPACQDEVPGTQEVPNCTAGYASALTSPGGTLYVARGENPWWFLQAGRTYLGGRDPADWTRDPDAPTVIHARRYLGQALWWEGDGGGYDTVVEGFHAIADEGDDVEHTMGTYWEGPGKLVLREVTLDGGGHEGGVESVGLQVFRGVVEVSDSVIDGGNAPTCYAVRSYGELSLDHTTLTGCGTANTSVMVENELGQVRMSDVTVAPSPGAAEVVGLNLPSGGAFLTAVTLRVEGVHEAVGLRIVGAEGRAEVKESAVWASTDTPEGVAIGVLADEGAVLIVANSAFATASDGSPAVDVGEGDVTLVNSHLVGASVALRVNELASVELVSNNLWGDALEALLDGTGAIVSADDLNACGWVGCARASGNTSQDPAYLDFAGGSFEVAADSPLVDVGVDPSPYGLIVDRDIDGNPSPSDGNGDGVPMWDVGPHER